MIALSDENTNFLKTHNMEELQKRTEALKYVFKYVADKNSLASLAGTILNSISHKILLLTKRDQVDGPESKPEMIERHRKEKEIFDSWTLLASQVDCLVLKKGQKIHDFRSSYNVMIKGKLYDKNLDKEWNSYSIVADWPIQINIIDKSKPLECKASE